MASHQLSESLRKCLGASEVAALFGRLEGRVYCVTGASSGFGLETAIAIAEGLMELCEQERVSIVFSDETIMLEKNEK